LAFHLRIGETLLVVLDSRYGSEGSLGTLPDGEGYYDAVALGQQQIDWFKNVVNDNADAKYLIVVNGTTTVDNVMPCTEFVHRRARRDSFGIYNKLERNELYRFVDEQTGFKNLLVVSGDDHFTKIHTRDWVHDERYDPTDPDVDYTGLRRHYFDDLDWWEFKLSLGRSQGLEPPYSDFGLGNIFGPPEVLAYDRSYTFLQLIFDTTGPSSSVTATVWARSTVANDHLAGSSDRTVFKLWERTLYYMPEQ
jgi:hypothetical protein